MTSWTSPDVSANQADRRALLADASRADRTLRLLVPIQAGGPLRTDITPSASGLVTPWIYRADVAEILYQKIRMEGDAGKWQGRNYQIPHALIRQLENGIDGYEGCDLIGQIPFANSLTGYQSKSLVHVLHPYAVLWLYKQYDIHPKGAELLVSALNARGLSERPAASQAPIAPELQMQIHKVQWSAICVHNGEDFLVQRIYDRFWVSAYDIARHLKHTNVTVLVKPCLDAQRAEEDKLKAVDPSARLSFFEREALLIHRTLGVTRPISRASWALSFSGLNRISGDRRKRAKYSQFYDDLQIQIQADYDDWLATQPAQSTNPAAHQLSEYSENGSL